MVDRRLTMRVLRIDDETQDIRRFELVSEDGGRLPSFTAGAHIDLHLGAEIIRQYSLCNGPDQVDSYTIAVKREPQSRGGSSALHDRVKVGDLIPVTGPRNHFPLDSTARQHLLLAGGIGVTPLLSMARHLKAQGVSFRMVYFTRSVQHTAFNDLLTGPEFAAEVEIRHGVEPSAMGEQLRALLAAHPAGGHVYACGPRPFMQLVEEIAAASYPPGAIHLEHFQADPEAQTGPRDAFRIRLAKSGKELDVPAGESMIDVLTRHGVRVEMMCQQGVCGTCLTGVLEGVPDHRDAFLSEAEKRANDKVLLCCSRALSPLLVLDL